MKEFISIFNGDKFILRIKSDGNIDLGPGVQLDDAAKLFYKKLIETMMNELPDLNDQIASKDLSKVLVIAGDRMASRIELLEHHKLADEHDVIARKMWIKAKDFVS